MGIPVGMKRFGLFFEDVEDKDDRTLRNKGTTKVSVPKNAESQNAIFFLVGKPLAAVKDAFQSFCIKSFLLQNCVN